MNELSIKLTLEEAQTIRDMLPKEPLGAFYYDLITKFDHLVKKHEIDANKYYYK